MLAWGNTEVFLVTGESEAPTLARGGVRAGEHLLCPSKRKRGANAKQVDEHSIHGTKYLLEGIAYFCPGDRHFLLFSGFSDVSGAVGASHSITAPQGTDEWCAPTPVLVGQQLVSLGMTTRCDKLLQAILDMMEQGTRRGGGAAGSCLLLPVVPGPGWSTGTGVRA